MRVFLCVCPLIDDDFHHNIVKIAVDPQGVLPSGSTAALIMLRKITINKRTDT